MRRRLTGFSLPWGGIQWENTEGDEEIARQTIQFLEDRRVLFNIPPHAENAIDAYGSVLQIRKFLTDQIMKSRPGKSVEQCLRAMRTACRAFVSSDLGNPSPDGEIAGDDLIRWHRSLGEFRARMGDQIALLVSNYDLPLEAELAEILPPPDDPGEFVPGFSEWLSEPADGGFESEPGGPAPRS